MRINDSNGIAGQVPGGVEPPASQPARLTAKTPEASAVPVGTGLKPVLPEAEGMQVESLVKLAAAGEEVNLQAVAEAKKLLAAGQLDSPEAAAAAAERILSLGI